MGWKDLLQSKDDTIVLPWTGGRTLRSGPRSWHINGKLPDEFGWFKFSIDSRSARVLSKEEPETDKLINLTRGYLVGDRLVRDDVSVNVDPSKIVYGSEPVLILEEGLDRFSRISVGRICEDGPFVFSGVEFPLGPEDLVIQAFEDRSPNLNEIKGISPALDAAFRMEVYQREVAEKHRAELERQRIEAERLKALEERRKQIAESLGTAVGRRELAAIDFEGAARAALAIGNATYLDHRPSRNRNEMVVKFRLNNRRFECTCDKDTLRIIDAGICLTAHYDDDEFEEGTKGDTFFTLETLPGVIMEAQRLGKLVIFRHAD